MRRFDLIVLSGATGAVGSYLLRRFLEDSSARIVCVLRAPSSYERLVRELVPDARQRIEPLFADLRVADEVDAAVVRCSGGTRCLAIHCAADVSWTKSKAVLAPINIDGTKHFAKLALALSRERPAFALLSTAYADTTSNIYRNSYEETKAEAERMLRRDHADALDLCVFRASLVVGARESGWIGRFNGLYPLIRLVALAEVPCIIGNASSRIDLVPVDWLADELLAAVGRLPAGGRGLEVVAAAGASAPRLGEIMAIVQERSRAFLGREGRSPNPPVSLIGARQYDFLMKASRQWGLREQFYHLDRIRDVMYGYITYATNIRELRPANVTTEAPAAHSFLPNVVDYWLAANSAKVLQARQPAWLGWQSAAQ
jgi:nucleoside-diphosphate-sugar epimerase